MAAVKEPVEQLELPDNEYPLSQAGKQTVPDDKLPVQFPAPPWVGAAEASHGSGTHAAAVTVPA